MEPLGLFAVSRLEHQLRGSLAYFAPYSYERHHGLGRAALSPKCEASVIGKTLDGRDMDLLTLGNGPTNVWVIHRQHPGEPMAEWFAEGLVERLTSDEDDDPAVAKALKECTWNLVPNMNPRRRLPRPPARERRRPTEPRVGPHEAPHLARLCAAPSRGGLLRGLRGDL